MRKQKHSKPFNIALKTFFFILFLPNLIFALDYPSFNGYQIFDLTSKNSDTFSLETQKWTVTGLSGTANSFVCGSNNPLLGDSGRFNNNPSLSKIYSSLPTHTAIYYQITLNLIDKFKPADKFTLKLDSTSIPGGSSLKTYNSYIITDNCGGSDPDTTQFTIVGSMPHTAKTLVFDLTAKFTGAGILGIRDILLTFANDSSVTTATSCFRVFDSQLFGISGECSCVKGSYSNSGTCTVCNSACRNCFGPSASQCFACASGYSYDGTQCIKCDSSCLTCTGPSSLQCVTCKDEYWLQLNGSCTATCDFPATSRQVVGSLQLCYSVCTTSQYFVWNGTCANNCSSPLVNGTAGTNKLCNKPCKTAGEYLYWNGSCIAECTGSLKSSSSNGVNLCNKPCQTGEYFDWNSFCITGCVPPLASSTTSDGILTCNKPCQTGEFLYWNSSCIFGCSAPLKLSSLKGVSTCNKPCQTGEYLDWNNNCVAGCGSPLVSSSTSHSVLTCNKPCQNSDYFYWNNSCITGCTGQLKSSSSNGVSICNKPCQTGEYLYWDGSCNIGCPTPLVSSTTSDGILECNEPCQAGEYLYENSLCIVGCLAPFKSTSLNGVDMCEKPCQTGEYFYWNNTCFTGCTSPLVSSTDDGVLTCNKPCQTGEYLYWNNSCITECDTPLILSTTSDNFLTCNQPCKTGEYLNWDNLCVGSCPSPFLSSISNNNVSNCSKPCENNEFLYKNNSCFSSCPLPFISLNTSGVALCNEPCQNNEYLYWNGTCNSTCLSPLISSKASQDFFCNKPCQDFEYLYEDNSCQVTCPTPYVTSNDGEVSLCKKPCDSNEFLNWNNACIASCPDPLVSSISNNISLCNKPCQTNEYLYSDGSCLSTCPSPFKSSSSLNVDLCQAPCSNPQFLYPDGSCSPKCPTPLVSSTPSDGIQRCNSPCPSPSDFYYNANNTCGSTCGTHGTIQVIEFLQVCLTLLPQPPSDQEELSPDEKKSVDQVTGVAEAAGKTASAGMAASSLISSKSSGAVTLISLIKMLEYIRYMDIDYPPKLEYMMSSQDESSISLNFDVELPESAQKKFPDYPLPKNFEKYHMLSSFLVNYWEALFTLAILLLILSASMFIASKAEDVKYVGTYSAKIRDILKWNFFLIVLCANIDSVGVFSSLELRTTHFDTFLSVLGTLICVFINLLVLYLMLLIPYIIYSLRRARGKTSPQGKNLQTRDPQRFALCGVLFMNFKRKSILQHSCMFFILLRVYLFNIIIGYLFEYPLPQAILITIMSFLMLGYLIITRPFKNPLELIKTLTYEIIITTVNISVLILAIMDHNGIKNKENRVQLGDVIIFSNMVFNLMAIVFIVVELVIKIIKVYQLRKTITAKGWRYWFTITTFLLEPEELEMEDNKSCKNVDPGIRIQIKRATKIEEKLPSPLDDQTGHDSDFAIEKNSSTPLTFSSAALRLNMNKVRISKTNSRISFDGWNDMSPKNILSPTSERTSLFIPQGRLSALSLLHSQGNHSAASSPRLELRLASQSIFQDLEQNKLLTDSLNLGTSRKLDEEKGIIIQRNRSSEVYLSNKVRKRNVRVSLPNSVIIDNNESGTDLSFEVGTGTASGMNTPRNQSRFSRFLPEKARNLHREEDS